MRHAQFAFQAWSLPLDVQERKLCGVPQKHIAVLSEAVAEAVAAGAQMVACSLGATRVRLFEVFVCWRTHAHAAALRAGSCRRPGSCLAWPAAPCSPRRAIEAMTSRSDRTGAAADVRGGCPDVVLRTHHCVPN